MTTYNGWTNYDTWNVALWFDNDEKLYNRLRAVLAEHPVATYEQVIEHLKLENSMTPDKIAYLSPHLDHDELNAWVTEHSVTLWGSLKDIWDFDAEDIV